MAEKVVDFRLKLALTNAKKAKAARIEKWKQLRTKPEPVVFELIGYPTKGHRKDWFEKEARAIVHQVFKNQGVTSCENSFVCKNFIMDTWPCWIESGYDVTIVQTQPPARSHWNTTIRLKKDEVYVSTKAVLQDGTKPFAAYRLALAKYANSITSATVEENKTVASAIERIQTAILQEAEHLASAGIVGIRMPRLYEMREVTKGQIYLIPDRPSEELVFQRSPVNMIPGLPFEEVKAVHNMRNEPTHFLPLHEGFVKSLTWGSLIWNTIE